MKNNATMFCPKCGSSLISGGKKEFETLCEHVSDPNNEYGRPLRFTWVCSSKECPTTQDDIFWDDQGDMYGYNKSFEFKDDLYSAYPSLARKLDIEIYKKGVKSRIYLSPSLMLWFLQPIIEYNYKADNYGNILKKSWKLKWLKSDRLFRGSYRFYYTFPIICILDNLRYNHQIIKDFNETLDSSAYNLRNIIDIFNPIPKWDKRWWRHFNLFLSKLLFNKTYKSVEYYKKLINK